MRRIVLSTFLLMLSLEARENPFFPSEGEKDLPYTSNESLGVPKLNRASVTLPSRARVIKKVIVEYENLDASLETKEIELNHSVDWHLPVFISQSFSQTDETEQVTKKVIKEVIEKKKDIYKKVASVEHAKFFIFKNNLKIITEDKLIRNFLLAQPHRIVLDFKRESSLKTYTQSMKNSIFTKIRVGNHDGYYRVVVELDGYYRYKLTKQADGCLVTLQ